MSLFDTVVCRKFNSTCGQLLNRGFLTMERRHSAILKKVKAMLPRRESERRVHPLARNSDILTATETRIGMLRMTFLKYIEMNYCCFIPGKVIDEILRILSLVEATCTPPRTHEVLQELRDISNMAMEHFDEEIVPNFKIHRPPAYPGVAGSSIFTPSLPGLIIKDTCRKDLNIVHHRTLLQKQQISVLKNLVGKLVSKIKKQSNVINSQTMKIREQSRKLKAQNTSISDLKRHVDEWDQKFADLVAELRPDETAPNSNSISPSPAKPTSTPSTNDTLLSSPPRTFKSNIKPRMAQIMPRSLSRLDLPNYDPDRKRKLITSSSVVAIPSKISRLQYHTIKSDEETNNDDTRSIFHRHSDTFSKIPSFLSSSLESLINAPITSIQSRKRKLQ